MSRFKAACTGILAAGLITAGCVPSSAVREVGTPAGADNKLAELQTELGVGYLREGKLDLAWQRLHKALEADSRYSAAHNAMGLLYERMGETSKAEEHFTKAVELDPVNSSAQNNFGGFLCRQGRYREGEERLLRAVKNPLYRSPQAAYANAGLCMKEAGDLTKAEGYLRSALRIDPRLAPALLAMAEVSFAKGEFLSARGYLQRYLEIAGHNPQTLWLGIRIERELGDRNTEASYALLLRSKYPDSPEAGKLRTQAAQ